MAKGVLCIDPSCGAEGDHLPQDVQEVVPGGGEDVPEGCSWVGLKLDVVRKLGQTWPVFLCRCSEGQEDFTELVKVSLSRKKGNPERHEWIITRTLHYWVFSLNSPE